jgi:hypothetical protein
MEGETRSSRIRIIAIRGPQGRLSSLASKFDRAGARINDFRSFAVIVGLGLSDHHHIDCKPDEWWSVVGAWDR